MSRGLIWNCAAVPRLDCPALFRLAEQQDCVVSREQLRECGVGTKAELAQLVAHRWTAAPPNAVVLHNGPLTRRQQWWVALLNAGPRAALCAFTALEADGLAGWGRPVIEVVVPRVSPALDRRGCGSTSRAVSTRSCICTRPADPRGPGPHAAPSTRQPGAPAHGPQSVCWRRSSSKGWQGRKTWNGSCTEPGGSATVSCWRLRPRTSPAARRRSRRSTSSASAGGMGCRSRPDRPSGSKRRVDVGTSTPSGFARTACMLWQRSTERCTCCPGVTGTTWSVPTNSFWMAASCCGSRRSRYEPTRIGWPLNCCAHFVSPSGRPGRRRG